MVSIVNYRKKIKRNENDFFQLISLYLQLVIGLEPINVIECSSAIEYLLLLRIHHPVWHR